MAENLFEANKIRTFTGIYIDVFDPKPEEIVIEDIAHALSNQCRFGGHLPVFYSVAQHSVFCSEYIGSEENALAALLHDASEAYLLDIPRPIKGRLSNYKETEERLMKIIADKFGFEWPMSQKVKEIDDRALKCEWDHIMIGMDDYLECWHPTRAKKIFLETYKQLVNDKGRVF